MKEEVKDNELVYEVTYGLVSGQKILKHLWRQPEESDEDFKWGVLDNLRLSPLVLKERDGSDYFFFTDKIESVEFEGPFTKEDADVRHKKRYQEQTNTENRFKELQKINDEIKEMLNQ